MTDEANLIDQVVDIMRGYWDLPADCNEGELYGYAEILVDKVRAGESKAALDDYLRDVQVEKMEMPASAAYSDIADRSIALLRISG